MKTLITLIIIFLNIHSAESQNWQQFVTLPGSGTTSMKMNDAGDLFFTTASYDYPAGQSAGVYRIISGSFITTPVNPASGTAYNARTIETEGMNNVWVSFWGNPSLMNEGLYTSTNKGNSWTRTFDAGTNNNIFSIAADPSNNDVYIGTRNGVYKSTDNGINFNPSGQGSGMGWVYEIDLIALNGFPLTKILAATSTGLFRSTNSGINWLKVSGIPQTDTVKKLVTIPSETGEKIIAGTDDGNLYISDEELFVYGLLFGFENAEIIAMMALDGISPFSYHLAASAFPKNTDALGTGMYYSYSSGTNWTEFGAGLPIPYKISALDGRLQGSTIKMFAGTYNNTSNGVTIYQKNYTVGVNTISTEVPASFSLSQNYPNPFNPKTKIKFEIQKTAYVKLVIYNSLGKEISTPVNERLNAGSYETEFDASELNSGVYFYKIVSLDAGGNSEYNFTETRKMILTK